MKESLLVIVLSISLISSAQKRNHEEVIDAEKSFAAYSVQHGTKAAFLNFWIAAVWCLIMESLLMALKPGIKNKRDPAF